ncbi:hypothetical protein MA16_Dca004047 [Dendrobium catenatum]|uniref:Uncharacterized protein n=1 Tax=Dendrobium catenatum TaxID=906689 RepID=A0A2I0X2A1_9ASPA|nr:hypothetical protein MA16_Dca004047 [Dendrobium catenatum]
MSYPRPLELVTDTYWTPPKGRCRPRGSNPVWRVLTVLAHRNIEICCRSEKRRGRTFTGWPFKPPPSRDTTQEGNHEGEVAAKQYRDLKSRRETSAAGPHHPPSPLSLSISLFVH